MIAASRRARGQQQPKTAEEIERMRRSCFIAADVLKRLCAMSEAGLNTYDLDQEGRKLIAAHGAVSACFNYQAAGHPPFPCHTCISINEEIVHGIGTLKRVIQPGDIVSVDVSIVHEGFIGDNARTVVIEPAGEEVRALVRSTEEALMLGLAQARHGNRVGDISHAVQQRVEADGFAVVRDFVGHGVGRTMHEEPQIPNYGPKGRGPRLESGMTLAIEPMVNLGRPEVEMADDGWTALTRDRKPSAHFEHTVLVRRGEPEILTKA